MTTQTVASAPAKGAVARQVASITALGAVLTINALANVLPLNGVTTGEVSDSFPSLFTPAGYVFSIWGAIYALLSVFAIYQALPSQKHNPNLERLGAWFVLSSVFNVAWLFSWHYGVIWLSQLFMIGLLLSLIVCYTRLGIGRTNVSWAETLSARLPFSVYLGWITVATVANTSIFLLDLGVTGGWLTPLWTVVAIASALGVGYLMLRNRGDVAYALVLVWAFVGIAAQQWGATLSVVIAALLAAGCVLVLIVQRPLKRRRIAA